MKVISVEIVLDPKTCKLVQGQMEVSDNYVEVKDKYRVGMVGPQIQAKPRTNHRMSTTQARRARAASRYKHGGHASSRIARKGR